MPIIFNPYAPIFKENYDIPQSVYQNSLSYYRQALTLPLPSMKDEEVDYVIKPLLKS